VGGTPTAPDATSDTAVSASTRAERAPSPVDAATAELPATPHDTDPAATTDVRDGDARTPASDRTSALTDRFSEHLSARGSSGATAAGDLTQADQLRLIQRVARAMEVAPQRGGLLRLRLRPPELGSLRLEVAMHDGTLSARIETETQTVKTLLLDQLPQLRDRLAEHGFRIERFDVDVAEQHDQQSADTPWQPPGTEDAWPTGPARPRAPKTPEPVAQPDPSTRSINFFVRPIRLDVVI
jgi:flagellar hook-length control protein FliK